MSDGHAIAPVDLELLLAQLEGQYTVLRGKLVGRSSAEREPLGNTNALFIVRTEAIIQGEGGVVMRVHNPQHAYRYNFAAAS